MNSVSAGPQASSAKPSPGCAGQQVDARRYRGRVHGQQVRERLCQLGPAGQATPTTPRPGRPAPCPRWSAPARRGGDRRRRPPPARAHRWSGGPRPGRPGPPRGARGRPGSRAERLRPEATTARDRSPARGPPRPTGSLSPTSCTAPAAVGLSARSTTRASTAPFQRLRSSETATSCGQAPAAASERCERRNATPRARAPPPTSEKRACLRSSPMAVTCSIPAAGTSSRGAGLAEPNGPSRSSSSASSSVSAPPGTTASTRSARTRSCGCQGRAGVGRQRGAEVVDTGGLDLQPGGHPVAAEAGQVLPRTPRGRRGGRTARCCGPSRGRMRRPAR